MKKILLITAFFIIISVNGQLRLVKDLYPAGGDSFPRNFAVSNGKLFFSSYYLPGSWYLNSSDGTAIGTDRVRFDDPNTGQYILNNSAIIKYYNYNNELYYSALDQNLSNFFALKISGNSNIGTKILNLTTSLNHLSGAGGQLTEAIFFNNEIIYNPVATNTGSGVELYKINLTTNVGSLIKDIWLTSGSSNPKDLIAFNNKIYFTANNGNLGREIWQTDGTGVGTSLYLDVITGTTGSNPDQLNTMGTILTFVADNTTTGRELFKTNGSGSLNVVRNINPTGDSNPTNVTKIDNTLYFSADNGTVGYELWKSDGSTSLGTFLVKDINPSGDSNISKLIKIGTSIYFTANDGTNGVELWKTDGTNAGTVLVKNINPTGNSNPDYLTEYNGKLYFTADNGSNGVELWVSDGTSIGTTMIEINPTASSAISDLIVFNNELYFGASVSVALGKEVYAYADPALNTNNFSLNEIAITLSPNPAKNYFELTTELSIEKIEIYSMLGQLVKTFDMQNQYAISDLGKGSYIVKIKTSEGTSNKTLLIE